MTQLEKRTRDTVWLRLPGYRVASLKSEFGEYTFELERAIQEGILACPDPARADFYDIALEWGSAYIHVYRDGRAVYLVAHKSNPDYVNLPASSFMSRFRPFEESNSSISDQQSANL
jgi:hypothetical protein